MERKARFPSRARGSAVRALGVGTILAIVVLGLAAACSQRFQREVDREMRRIYNPSVADVCQADRERLCGVETAGRGRAATCLANHEDDLSPACRDVVMGRENVRNACKSDLVKLCKETGNRPQLRLGCLKRQRNQLTSGCSSALDDANL